MSRNVSIKNPPNRGNLTERLVQRAVEKVIYARRGSGATISSAEQKRDVTSIKVGRDAKTGRSMSCKEAERRKAKAVIETNKRLK